MARQKPNDLKKSVTNKRLDNPDPQEEHKRQLKDDGKPDPDEPGQDLFSVKQKVEVLGEGVTINGHPMRGRTETLSGARFEDVQGDNRGDVVEISVEEIRQHRAQGVRLVCVPDDFDGELYDVSETWKNPDNVED